MPPGSEPASCVPWESFAPVFTGTSRCGASPSLPPPVGLEHPESAVTDPLALPGLSAAGGTLACSGEGGAVAGDCCRGPGGPAPAVPPSWTGLCEGESLSLRPDGEVRPSSPGTSPCAGAEAVFPSLSLMLPSFRLRTGTYPRPPWFELESRQWWSSPSRRSGGSCCTTCQVW